MNPDLMNRAPFSLAAIVLAVLALSVCREAHALGPVDIEVGLVAGGGTTPTNGGRAALVGGLGGPAPN